MKSILRAAALGASAVALVTACATTAPEWPEGQDASADRFKSHVETLAADEFMGREAGTEGYDMAVTYLTAQFDALGLTPAGSDGYLQQVPLRRAFRDTDSMSFDIEIGGERQTLSVVDHYLLDAPISSDPTAEAARLSVEGGIVFAGYGIDAPALGIDSYEDLDVTGKVVLLMQGTPDGMPSEERAHFQRGAAKIDEAARRGASAVLFLGTRDAADKGFRERMDAFAAAPSETFAGRGAAGAGVVSGFLFKTAAQDLFDAAGLNHDTAIVADENGRIAPMALDANAMLTTQGRFENYTSPNVVAMIEGSDPTLKDEYVVLSAHLDHVGVDEIDEDEPDADVIHNGAMDNATGIATMLEAARRFQKSGEAPKRSILFVAVTAEEKGLLGSDYFAQNPTVPAERMVANVNLDMPILLYDFEDVIAFGAEHSSLGLIVEAATTSMDVGLTADPYPELVLFVRSDHYSFVKQGVPSVFLFLGTEGGGEENFRTFMQTHYHRVSDQPDLPIRYDVAAKFAELNYRIAKEIADADQAPVWNDDNFFGDLYAAE